MTRLHKIDGCTGCGRVRMTRRLGRERLCCSCLSVEGIERARKAQAEMERLARRCAELEEAAA